MNEYEFEDKDEQIKALSDFINDLVNEAEDERKTDDYLEFHHAHEYMGEVDFRNPSDEDFREVLNLIPNGLWSKFVDYAMSKGHLHLQRIEGNGIYYREITSWSDDSYSISFENREGTVNGVEVSDVGTTLCEGLTKEEILKAVRKSYASSVEEWSGNIPLYLYAEPGDNYRVILRASDDQDEFRKHIQIFLDGERRGNPNKAGRVVIKDGVKIALTDKDLVKKNPKIVKAIKNYMKNPAPGAGVKSNYKVIIYDSGIIIGELSLADFRASMKATLSSSIDELIKKFNSCMSEKAVLIKVGKK